LRNEEKEANTVAGLQERLNEFKKVFESGAPPDNALHKANEKMHRGRTELKASGTGEGAIKVGDRAPSFMLFNQDVVQVTSSAILHKEPLALRFLFDVLVDLHLKPQSSFGLSCDA
jgi:hypothetical protein